MEVRGLEVQIRGDKSGLPVPCCLLLALRDAFRLIVTSSGRHDAGGAVVCTL